jgi:hypothetical protein
VVFEKEVLSELKQALSCMNVDGMARKYFCIGFVMGCGFSLAKAEDMVREDPELNG